MEDFLAQRAAEKKALSSIAGVKKERVVKAEGTVLGKSHSFPLATILSNTVFNSVFLIREPRAN